METSKAERKRDKIIEAARYFFNKYDYEYVTVDKIINYLDISKGGFYYHFKSKSELYYEVMFSDVLDIDEYYNNIKNKHNADVQLSMVIKYIGSAISEFNPEKFYILFNNAVRDHYSNSLYSEKIVKPIYDVYKLIINDGVKTNVFRNDIETDSLIESMFTMTLGNLYAWCYSNGAIEIEKSTDNLINILLNGMKR